MARLKNGQFILTVATLLLAAARLHTELIPAVRLTDWQAGVNVGVPGGIPTNRTHLIDVTRSPYNADNTGATDATKAIQSAIDASAEGDVIYLPAGTYRYLGVGFGPNQSNRTLRGAGMGQTKLLTTKNNAIYVGSGSDYSYSWPASGNIMTAAKLSKGSDTIAIADTSSFAVGQMILLAVKNQQDDAAIEAGAVPVYQVRPLDQYVRKQMARVVGKTSSTIKFSPPLHFDVTGLDIKVNVFQRMGSGVGIEDMTIDCTNAQTQWAVWFEQCYGCWIKNVKVTNALNYAFFLTNSLNCEVRGSYANQRKPGGSNGAGLLVNTVGSCLFEDNIVFKFNPGIEVNQSSTGNVIAYNLFEDSRPTASINSNHNPHNSFNLYEGNIAGSIQADGYYGSVSEDTFFRNWITGTIFDHSAFTFIVGLNRFTRNYSLVGNILGTVEWPYGDNPYSFGNPNIGNSYFSGSAQPGAAKFWADWKATATLTSRISDNAGAITINGAARIGQFYNAPFILWDGGAALLTNINPSDNVVTFTCLATLPAQGSTLKLYTGENGFQEKDLDVEATTILRANYHMWGSQGPGIPKNQALGTDTLPASMFRNEKPAWFGNLAWPPFDPTAPNPSYDSIPAGYRFVHGTDIQSGGGDQIPPTVPQNVTAAVRGTQINLTWAVSTDNVGVTGYSVERSQGAGSTKFTQVATPTGLSYSDTGLSAVTLYNYRVRAMDAAGNWSDYSSVTSATTATTATTSSNGLVVANAFNEGSGASVADTSGNGNTGTLFNNPSWVAGESGSGYALSLDGSTQYVDIGNGSSLNITGNITVSAWINVSALPSSGSFATIVEKGYDGTNEGYYLRLNNLSGILSLDWGSYASPIINGTSIASTLKTAIWYHIAGTWDGSAWKLYVNGSNVASTTNANGPVASSGRVSIGASSLSGIQSRFFSGVIDDLRIYNRALSQAEIQADMNTPVGNGGDQTPPTVPQNLVATSTGASQVNLTWEAASDNSGVTGYILDRSQGAGSTAYTQMATLAGSSYSDTGLVASIVYNYRIRAVDAAKNLSGFSSVATATTASATGKASAVFVKMDTGTQGNWKGVYGMDGYNIINDTENYPAYATVTSSGNDNWTWVDSTSDGRALYKKQGTDQIAACWYSSTNFLIDVNLADSQSHRVALYCLDWDSYGPRSETVDILDAGTNAVLDTRTISSFQNGHYLVWDIKGHVVIRAANNVVNSNAVCSGLFFSVPTVPSPPTGLRLISH